MAKNTHKPKSPAPRATQTLTVQRTDNSGGTSGPRILIQKGDLELYQSKGYKLIPESQIRAENAPGANSTNPPCPVDSDFPESDGGDDESDDDAPTIPDASDQ